MTKEEIIDGLKFTVEMFLLDPSTGETITEPRNDMDKITIDACRGAIELLEQEGHWIEISRGFECDQCHGIDTDGLEPPYCKCCGAKMVEPQESEE